MVRLYTIFLIFFSAVIFHPAVGASNNDNKDKEKKESAKKSKDKNETDGKENKEGESEEDTISGAQLLSSIIWDMNDSLMNIPAYDIYGDWNTGDIHPYKFDLTKKIDTTYIYLQDEGQCGYSHPVTGYITSNFGPRSSRFHYGIDIKLQTGDSVYNAFEGVVRIAQTSKTYGNVVVIRHNNGLETLYAHLSKIDVEVGRSLNAGEIIGLGGNTGRSTGSHLHFEVRFKGEPINPNEIIDFESCLLKTDVLAINKAHFAYLKEIRAVKYHTVRKGDSLGLIARKYGTSVSRLCKLNRIKSSTMLKVGRKIRYA